MPDFIRVYLSALAPDVCQHLLDKFDSSGQAMQGRTGSGVDVSLKHSTDITISSRTDWQAENQLLNNAMLGGLLRYIREYPQLIHGAVTLQVQDAATKQLRKLSIDDLQQMPDGELIRYVTKVLRPGSINIQKYKDGVGGYPHWHSEIYPKDSTGETLHRVLLWTIYLNDVPEEGETEFFFQQRKIKPAQGSLLIAPAGFTHTHCGHTPKGSDKYIATSWILFQRAEQLYGG
jgi:2OG-Fe(II) oxygenase superfamily